MAGRSGLPSLSEATLLHRWAVERVNGAITVGGWGGSGCQQGSLTLNRLLYRLQERGNDKLGWLKQIKDLTGAMHLTQV